MKKFMLLLTVLLISVGSVVAQMKEVSGVVLNQKDNQPLTRVTVKAKSGKGGAYTDAQGRFRFNVPATEKMLVVSLVGMTTIEVPVGTNLKILLKEESSVLEDVVVIGYGSGKAITNTSASVVKVGAKDLEQKPVANPFDAVQGKVAGLQVLSSSGEPSEISSVRLHGSGSLGASSTPLYVLDGMPVGAGIVMSMNPNDFESFQVLKDAAATSIYGARAANGVIYITTKKGRVSERGNITFRTQYGVSNLANKDYYESLMNSRELGQLYKDLKFYDDETEEKINKIWESGIDTKWHDYYFKKNQPLRTADIAFSGGSGSTNYYISSGFLQQQGLRYRSGYERYNIRANINSNLNPIIKVGLNTAITYDVSETNQYTRNSTNGGLSSLALPWYSPYDKDGNEYYDVKIPGWNRWSPRYLADKIPSNSRSLTMVSAGNLTITPFKGMTIRSQVGLELTDTRGTTTRYPSFGDSFGNGFRRQSFGRDINWTVTNTAEYKFRIGDDHQITSLIGQEYIDNRYESFRGEGQGLIDDKLILLSSVTKDKELGESYSASAFLSYFAQLSYSYRDKYFVDLTARNDASSRFGADNKNASFGSLGLLWKAKNESFLKDIDWLDNLRVKFSTGTSGNAGIGNYEAQQQVGKIGQYDSGASWGLSSPGNPKLTWETQWKTTLGFDARILDIIGLNVEVYNRLTSSMLMDVPYPHTSGFSSLKENVGKYQNRGVDIRLDVDVYNNKSNGNFVALYGNFNYNRDKILELFRGLDTWIMHNYGLAYVVGQPVTFFYPIWKGVDPNTGAPQWYNPGANNAITNKDDKDVFTPTDEEPFSSDALAQNTGISRQAPINGGFGLNAQFYGFSLQADFAFTLGKHLITNDDYFFSQNPYVFSMNVRKEILDYWKNPGDVTKYPSLAHNFVEFDSRMIKNASFARLKNLTLGYTLPKSLLAKQNIIRGAKVFVSGRNLLTFTKFDGVDPEVDSNLTLGANPNTKQVSVGLELNF
ncbi:MULTISPECIES: SusC/RagA family TonB-linked outer membrane protein [unclassified Porphyromonas]|uniref:SusC/RagA family TonB-linked outer membrane protein n=1 Tax=unclassified Porphyromonas TaxID=2645799 RepID=UPI00052C08B0|nr:MULTISPECIES: SusC/RagA family TonB-linked outer membrane protein [unclassified Porphyromonas]KGN70412.1 hypothetical protein JT26_02705 [Porphyromonas sp. COT-108 OH1349]KGN95491.1 hypothetical protein HQ39_04305 [Porphyromonas sp. COT-108 OH2963]